MQQQITKTIHRKDMDEHLLILNTIVTDLTSDVKVIEFMTYTKNGVILTHFLPIDTVITELREASTLLTNGLHFPFRIQTANWQIIKKLIIISAHYDYPSIYIKLSDCSIPDV